MNSARLLRDAREPGAREHPTSSVAPPCGWHARLELGFAQHDGTTRLAMRRHSGPLVVQRPLYPEGRGSCHAIVVHPPGGIAGGDVVELDIAADAGAHAVVTTPGAGKLYKSAGRVAEQRVRLRAQRRACIEWLPQETIVFDEADALLALDVDVSNDALVLAWDIATLGREAMGERFLRGRLRSHLCVRIDGRLALWESGEVLGNGAWLDSPAGWRGCRTCGTFIVVGRAIDDALVEACREPMQSRRDCAVSRLAPSLVVARYLGASAAGAREAFAALWSRLRPALAAMPARAPRIWAT